MKKDEIMKDLVNTMFYMWLKFSSETGANIEMSPHQWDLIKYEGENKWELNENFQFAALNSVEVTDKTFKCEQGMRAEVLTKGGKDYLVVNFLMKPSRSELTSYQIYARPISEVAVIDLRRILKELILVWYESLMRKDQELLWSYVDERFEKIITYK